jgi:ketosteroid isomerase-like protein
MSDEQQIRALIDAYRDTWPPFFQWQAGGAVFEIESLVVTAGTEVAFASALLRCGTAAHEHHSFPSTTGPDATPSSDVARS